MTPEQEAEYDRLFALVAADEEPQRLAELEAIERLAPTEEEEREDREPKTAYQGFLDGTGLEDSNESHLLFEQDIRDAFKAFQGKQLAAFTNRPASKGKSIAEELREKRHAETHKFLDEIGAESMEQDLPAVGSTPPNITTATIG